MNCWQKGCGGKVNTAVSKKLAIGCSDGCGKVFVKISFNPCEKCGLLHYPSGMAAFQIGTGEGFFLMEDKDRVAYKKVVLI